VTCPILLVGAESFLLDSAERIAAALPHTRLERLPKVGHIALLDNPHEFLQIVDRFLTAER
jgi:pimeloyl-ACP methyl ester carboxylesterase